MAEGDSVLRRKAAAGRLPEVGAMTPAKALRLALARAGQAVPGLDLTVEKLDEARRSLAELLDLPPERALLAMIEGPGEGLGLVAISPGMLTALIEMMTTGRAGTGEPAARKATRTDAAMTAGMVDRILAGLETDLASSLDVIWAGGFRYASFLDDPRPLGLLLEDVPYRVFQADLSFARGQRRGEVLIALPAEGRGAPPKAVAKQAARAAPAVRLADVVMTAPATLSAVLHRLTIPLSAVLGLRAGDLVPIPATALERIVLEGVDGRRLAEGKLGQNRGSRAVRLNPQPGQAEAAAAPEARSATG